MTTETPIDALLDLFYAELCHVMDANDLALRKVARRKGHDFGVADLQDLVAGLREFYGWMDARHRRAPVSPVRSDGGTDCRTTAEAIRQIVQDPAGKIFGLDAIDRYLDGLLANFIDLPSDPAMRDAVFIRACWEHLCGQLDRLLRHLEPGRTPLKLGSTVPPGESHDLAEVRPDVAWDAFDLGRCSFLPRRSDRRVRRDTVREHLQSQLGRCTEKGDRLPFWVGAAGDSVHAGLRSDRCPHWAPAGDLLGPDFVLVLFALSAKYQILIHCLRHSSGRVVGGYQWIAAVFTFVMAFSKYYAHLCRPGGVCFDKWLITLGHLRRGVALAQDEDDASAHSRAFNEFEHAARAARLPGSSQPNLAPTAAAVRRRAQLMAARYDTLVPIMSCFLKGELYRRDCAFHNAREYYYDGVRDCHALVRGAVRGGRRVEPSGVPAAATTRILRHSYSLVRANVNLAKVYLELGEFRRALKWIGRALTWYPRSDVALLARGKRAALNNVLDRADRQLHQHKHDPLVRKAEVTRVAGATLEALNVIGASPRPMLSELVNVVAMLLYQMRIDRHPEIVKDVQDPEVPDPAAFAWLELALRLDPDNPLALHNVRLFQAEWKTKFNVSTNGRTQPADESLARCAARASRGGDGIPDFQRNRELTSMDRWDRRMAFQMLDRLEPAKAAVGTLLASFLAYTERFSKKNVELLRYLTREPTLNGIGPGDDAYFKTLRRWSSFTPSVPRPAAATSRGGGYLLITRPDPDQTRRYGVVIDPGFDFLRNLYVEGHSLSDIDLIVVTHNHIDHTADLDPALSLLNYLSKLRDKTPIDLVVNETVANRYSFYVSQRRLPSNVVRAMHVLAPSASLEIALSAGHSLAIDALPAVHAELGGENCALGLVFRDRITVGLPGQDGGVPGSDASSATTELVIGYTGDTHPRAFTTPVGPLPAGSDQERQEAAAARAKQEAAAARWKKLLLECRLIVANIGTVPFPEMVQRTGVTGVLDLALDLLNDSGVSPEGGMLSEDLASSVARVRAILWSLWHEASDKAWQLPENPRDYPAYRAWYARLLATVCLTLGHYENGSDFLTSLKRWETELMKGSRDRRHAGLAMEEFRRSDELRQEFVKLADDRLCADTWGHHLYLNGVFSLAALLKDGKASLIISEFREELGSFRHQIARYLERSMEAWLHRVHTADTDLCVRLSHTREGDALTLRCSRCKLNNDCAPADMFHVEASIRAVCVKGESDAMYYMCPRHTPGFGNEQFMEKLPAYKPFDLEMRY